MRVKKLDESSVEWARLEEAETSSVGALIDSLEESLALADKRYLFDWSLPLNCPCLAQQLVIPKYFAGTVRLAVLVCFVSNLSDVFSQAVCPSVCYDLPLSLSL